MALTKPVVKTSGLTRKKLATFLNSHDLIKTFENMTTDITTTLPDAIANIVPTTMVIGDLLYAASSDTLTTLNDVATGNVLISGGVAVAPLWGKVDLTAHVSGLLPMANGGLNANLSPSNGGIFYSTATAGALLSGTPTANQIILSGAAGAPAWSTATYPATAGTAANVLRSDGTNFLSAQLAAADLSNGTIGAGAVVLASSPTLTTPNIGAAIGTSLALTGALKSSSSSAGIGYSTGAGGTVSQATSKSTGVTLNKICGDITMNGAAFAAGAEVSFVVTNSAVAATDCPSVAVVSGGTANAYRANVTAVAAGSFTITVQNITAGSLSEQPIIRFSVGKSVNS